MVNAGHVKRIGSGQGVPWRFENRATKAFHAIVEAACAGSLSKTTISRSESDKSASPKDFAAPQPIESRSSPARLNEKDCSRVDLVG
jgi:hypothetical protein